MDDLKEEIKSKEVKILPWCLLFNNLFLFIQNDFKSIEEACDEIALFDEEEQIPYLVGEVFIYQGVEKTQVLHLKIYNYIIFSIVNYI